MKKKIVAVEKEEAKVISVSCKICHEEVTGGVLSSKGAICYGCAENIRSNNMAKKIAKEAVKEGKVKGKKAPKPVTLREKGIGPNLCINIPIIKENKELMDAIAVYREAYHVSMNNLLFVALAKFLGLKTIKLD